MREGYYSDKYFVRTRELLLKDHHRPCVTMQVFVSAPYDQYVGTNTRWWHASGVDLRLDSSGFKLNTQSLATVIVGGLSFQSPPGKKSIRDRRFRTSGSPRISRMHPVSSVITAA